MKKLSLFVTAFIFVLTLSACGGGSDDPVITIGVDSDRVGEALVEKWDEENPDDEGLVEFSNYGSANDDNSGMQGIELAQDEAPDIALVIDNEVIGREGSLLPLNDELATLGEEQTHETAFEDINQLDNFYLPAFYDGMVFSWNETILNELDISTEDTDGDNLPDAIDTWEKIFAIAEDMPADDRPEIDVPENDETYTMYELFPISLDEVWSGYSSLTAGGWKLFPDGDYTEPGFDSDEFEKGLEFIKEFSESNMSVDETGSQKAADEMAWRWDSYLDGAYPMSLVGTWQDVDGSEEETGFDFRFSVMPTYEGEDLHPFTKTKGFVINGYTPYPEEAQRVMEWLYTDTTFESMINNSAYLPALQEDADIFPEIDDENKEEFSIAMDNNHFEPSATLPNNYDVRAMSVLYNNDLNAYFKEVWDGDRSPADTRQAIADDAEAWIEANNQ